VSDNVSVPTTTDLYHRLDSVISALGNSVLLRWRVGMQMWPHLRYMDPSSASFQSDTLLGFPVVMDYRDPRRLAVEVLVNGEWYDAEHREETPGHWTLPVFTLHKLGPLA